MPQLPCSTAVAAVVSCSQISYMSSAVQRQNRRWLILKHYTTTTTIRVPFRYKSALGFWRIFFYPGAAAVTTWMEIKFHPTEFNNPILTRSSIKFPSKLIAQSDTERTRQKMQSQRRGRDIFMVFYWNINTVSLFLYCILHNTNGILHIEQSSKCSIGISSFIPYVINIGSSKPRHFQLLF